MDREQFLEVYRHSLAHILAKAVMEIFGRENVQIAIGPQIADGMYYDFLLPRGISTEDFPAIEQKMKEIMKRKEPWTVRSSRARSTRRSSSTICPKMRPSPSTTPATTSWTCAAAPTWRTPRSF